jgi:anaphase-promoting complex subunit 6
MEAYLRKWQKDALDRHSYDAAIFVGDKLLALTSTHSTPRLAVMGD